MSNSIIISYDDQIPYNIQHIYKKKYVYPIICLTIASCIILLLLGSIKPMYKKDGSSVNYPDKIFNIIIPIHDYYDNEKEYITIFMSILWYFISSCLFIVSLIWLKYNKERYITEIRDYNNFLFSRF